MLYVLVNISYVKVIHYQNTKKKCVKNFVILNKKLCILHALDQSILSSLLQDNCVGDTKCDVAMEQT